MKGGWGIKRGGEFTPAASAAILSKMFPPRGVLEPATICGEFTGVAFFGVALRGVVLFLGLCFFFGKSELFGPFFYF